MFKIYLDYAASTPVNPEVKAAMEPYFSEIFGNAGALHWFGQEASAAIFKARQTIAKIIGANYKELVFTGSATEANNLVLRGVATAELRRLNADNRRKRFNLRPRFIVSAIEHESILETCRDLEKEGVEVIYIPVSPEGIVDLKKLKAALNKRTVLVSVMYANNQIGTIQPIKEISKLISEFRIQNLGFRENKKLIIPLNSKSYPLFHTDAVQAFQYLDCDVNNLGVDLMTLSAHKIYGPKGIGALYVKNRESGIRNQELKKSLIHNSKFILPILTGGGQERGWRSGTENTPSIVGFAKAAELTEKMKKPEGKRVGRLRDYLLKELKKIHPKILVNGSMGKRIPNNLNVYFPGYLDGDLVIRMDLDGLAVSPGAACSARSLRPSYVLEALELSKERSAGSIRISLGRQTVKKEINVFVKKLKSLLK